MTRRVLCCGTFDYLHPGHLYFLERAARLGDELFVVVARDENVNRLKGCYPDHDEDERCRQIAKLEFVDDVRLGYPGRNFLKVVEDIRPDLIALGYDQRLPPGFKEAFPQCEIVTIDAHQPDKFKSSIYRKARQLGENQ